MVVSISRAQEFMSLLTQLLATTGADAACSLLMFKSNSPETYNPETGRGRWLLTSNPETGGGRWLLMFKTNSTKTYNPETGGGC